MTSDDSLLPSMADRLLALGNPTRLSLFRLLVRSGAQGRSVGDVQKILSIPASTLSHHLKHLELVGLITKRREGTTHYCSAQYDTMDELMLFLAKECCRDVERDRKATHVAHSLQS